MSSTYLELCDRCGETERKAVEGDVPNGWVVVDGSPMFEGSLCRRCVGDFKRWLSAGTDRPVAHKEKD